MDRGRAFGERIFGAMLPAVPLDLRDDLLLVQYQRVAGLVPILYLTVAINAAASGLAAHGNFPVAYQFVFLGGLLCACVWRYLVWRNRTQGDSDLINARINLRATSWVAIILSLLGGLWTLVSYLQTNEVRGILAAVFILMTTFATATCLISLARTAICSAVAALLPITIALLLSSDPIIMTVGVSFGVVILLFAQLVTNNFSETIDNLRLNRDLKLLSETDALTGAKNRRAFAGAVDQLRERRVGEFAIFLMDLNGFKRANDQYGHSVGDIILTGVVERLELLFPVDACVARLGGDEFAVLVPNAGNAELCGDRAAAVRKTLALPHVCNGKLISVSVSVGISRYPEHGKDLPQLLKHADQLLYSEKSEVSAPKPAHDRRTHR
jgi:diguanylate cyclase (GGDEF)-like protein